MTRESLAQTKIVYPCTGCSIPGGDNHALNCAMRIPIEKLCAAYTRHEAREVVAWGCLAPECRWFKWRVILNSVEQAQEMHDLDRTEPWMCRARVRALAEKE